MKQSRAIITKILTWHAKWCEMRPAKCGHAEYNEHGQPVFIVIPGNDEEFGATKRRNLRPKRLTRHWTSIKPSPGNFNSFNFDSSGQLVQWLSNRWGEIGENEEKDGQEKKVSKHKKDFNSRVWICRVICGGFAHLDLKQRHGVALEDLAEIEVQKSSEEAKLADKCPQLSFIETEMNA